MSDTELDFFFPQRKRQCLSTSENARYAAPVTRLNSSNSMLARPAAGFLSFFANSFANSYSQGTATENSANTIFRPSADAETLDIPLSNKLLEELYETGEETRMEPVFSELRMWDVAQENAQQREDLENFMCEERKSLEPLFPDITNEEVGVDNEEDEGYLHPPKVDKDGEAPIDMTTNGYIDHGAAVAIDTRDKKTAAAMSKPKVEKENPPIDPDLKNSASSRSRFQSQGGTEQAYGGDLSGGSNQEPAIDVLEWYRYYSPPAANPAHGIPRQQPALSSLSTSRNSTPQSNSIHRSPNTPSHSRGHRHQPYPEVKPKAPSKSESPYPGQLMWINSHPPVQSPPSPRRPLPLKVRMRREAEAIARKTMNAMPGTVFNPSPEMRAAINIPTGPVRFVDVENRLKVHLKPFD